MDDVRICFLGLLHSTTPATVTTKKLQKRSPLIAEKTFKRRVWASFEYKIFFGDTECTGNESQRKNTVIRVSTRHIVLTYSILFVVRCVVMLKCTAMHFCV